MRRMHGLGVRAQRPNPALDSGRRRKEELLEIVQEVEAEGGRLDALQIAPNQASSLGFTASAQGNGW